MKNWYRITAKQDTSFDVHLYDEIGVWGISAQAFVDEFKKIPPEAAVNLFINSPGGSVWDGLAIYNAIDRHTAMDTIESWDSITHINLCFSLEQDFQLAFTVAEIETMLSYGDILRVLREKL
jgi:acyl carrier protein